MTSTNRPSPSLLGRIVNDLTLAAAVVEVFRQHPGLPDELCEMADTALARLLRAGEQLSGYAPLPSHSAPQSAGPSPAAGRASRAPGRRRV